MQTSIKKELLNHILDRINDRVLTNQNIDDWRFHCFNEDYYIIYHSKAIQWLKIHSIDTFEAIETVKDYELQHFGEFTTKINPESIVNMLAYIYGEELMYSFNIDSVDKLKKEVLTELEDKNNN